MTPIPEIRRVACRANENQGAESTLAYLLSLTVLAQLEASVTATRVAEPSAQGPGCS